MEQLVSGFNPLHGFRNLIYCWLRQMEQLLFARTKKEFIYTGFLAQSSNFSCQTLGDCLCTPDALHNSNSIRYFWASVWKLCVKESVWQSSVWKMMCDKVVCEIWCGERWCVTKLCAKDGVVKDGVWQSYVWKMVSWKMVCEKVVCEGWCRERW